MKTTGGWVHLDPKDNHPREAPSELELRTLLKDAFSANPARYGDIVSVNGNTVATNTGIKVVLDWNRMTLNQTGKDTDRIDLLYRIHYLQWTGVKAIDRVVGLVGIALILVLTSFGAVLAFKR